MASLLAAAAAASDPADTIRLGKSAANCVINTGTAFKELALAVAERDPEHLKNCSWSVLKGAGNVIDAAVYTVAIGVSWIPVVNWVPLGWAWSKIPRGE